MSTSLVLAVQGEEQLRELPMPSWMYAVLFLVGFGLLLGITWSFRNTANKVRAGAGPGTAVGHGSADQHGHAQPGHEGHS
jgi:hypothetical protein